MQDEWGSRWVARRTKQLPPAKRHPLSSRSRRRLSSSCRRQPGRRRGRSRPLERPRDGPVHSGEGARGPARAALPLRVADPGTYAREKQRAEQRTGLGSPFSAAAPGPTAGPTATAAPLAAVFGSLNAAGLSASQEIAAFGHEGTPPDTTGAIGPEDYVEFVNSEVAAYKRSNLALVGSPVELAAFIGAVAPCDPQIKYDAKSSRWFYSAIRCDGTRTSNTLYLGFSKTSDPTDFSTATGHGWCGYAYSTAAPSRTTTSSAWTPRTS